MRLTRQSWARLSLAGFLAAFAVLLGRPLPLAGVSLIGASILAAQCSFLGALDRAVRRLSVTRSGPSATVRADESTPVAIDATLAKPTTLHLEVDAGLPAATATPDRDAATVRLAPETTAATETATVTWPVAGRHRFDRARVTATDGQFVETFAAGDRPAVSVEARGPRHVHVGAGGDRLASPYGAHALRRSSRGLEPAELREQVPGDAAKRIDWKATARLGTPHVREYETETTRRTLLVIDHRRSLATGPPAKTKLDYLREVMLTMVESARDRDDPVGIVGVDERGTTISIDPTAGTYATVHRELLEIEPTRPAPTALAAGRSAGSSANASADAAGTPRPSGTDDGLVGSVHDRPTRSTARRSALDLEAEATPFAETLYPFYADAERYRRLARDRPLTDAVRTAATASASATEIAVFTDDSDPAELRETVAIAGERAAAVTVFLAPTVLYEPGATDDLERAYERYREFEDLRGELAGREGVRAFEVGPGDRLGAVLEAGRDRGGRR